MKLFFYLQKAIEHILLLSYNYTNIIFVLYGLSCDLHDILIKIFFGFFFNLTSDYSFLKL